MYYINPFKLTFDLETILPLTKICLENEYFNAPCKIEKFMKGIYGSLDPKAKFCKETGKYHLDIEDKSTTEDDSTE